MANLDITIKRKNGAGYDVLYPTTIIAQVEGLQTALDGKISTTARGAANGVAPLGSDSKVPLANLPSFLTGASKGFYLVGSLSTSTDLDTLKTAIESGLGTYPNYSTGGGETPANRQGYSWVATSQIAISWTDVQDTKYFLTEPGDELDATSPIQLEVGDMIVFTKFVSSTASESGWHFSVINNSYQDAGINGVKGIVTLSNATVTDSMNGSSKVITEDVLFDTIGTTAGKIAAGNHNHDSTYLGINANAVSASKWATARTITLNGDASGSVSIDGSANVTLTVAVADDSHTHAFANLTSKPTTLSGYGITDAYTETEVDTLISNTIANRPEIYYNASANSDGDLVLDLDSDGAVA